MNKPRVTKDELYQLLRLEQIELFNEKRTQGMNVDLTGTDLRGLDLRNMNVKGVDFINCYFRQADLRGVDFSESNLEGASIYGAKISGAYFPKDISAEEINLSLTHGTRMRSLKK